MDAQLEKSTWMSFLFVFEKNQILFRLNVLLRAAFSLTFFAVEKGENPLGLFRSHNKLLKTLFGLLQK